MLFAFISSFYLCYLRFILVSSLSLSVFQFVSTWFNCLQWFYFSSYMPSFKLIIYARRKHSLPCYPQSITFDFMWTAYWVIEWWNKEKRSKSKSIVSKVHTTFTLGPTMFACYFALRLHATGSCLERMLHVSEKLNRWKWKETIWWRCSQLPSLKFNLSKSERNHNNNIN